MESSEIAFSLFDEDKDGYVTSNEMKKISKTLTEDQVNKESTYIQELLCIVNIYKSQHYDAQFTENTLFVL